MRHLVLLFFFVIGVLSSGCAAVDTVDSRLDAVNRTINDARNQSILLNIARASYGHPLNFVSISNIGGGGSVGGGMGLPNFTFGPGLTEAQRQYTFGGNSINGSVNGSFSINPLESKEFYTGLLAPLDLKTAQFFIAQGFPKELVFYLFVDGLTLRTPSGIVYVANDPDSPAFPRFVDYMHRAVDYGLTLENSGKTNAIRLCFDPALARKPLGKLQPVCRSNSAETGIRNFVEGAIGRVDVELKVRSTYQIFQYIGQLSARDGSKVTLVSPELNRRSGTGSSPLFPVSHSIASGPCLASVTYSGDYFCVPATRNETGGRVIDLMTILVALTSSVRDLPPIQNIRVTQ
ncbi:hypothetical protein ACQY1H_22530 (plasmid) [Agrobacterium vitis]|uniref:hypothetical protein n=1 Tax=Agrobacterium vitis TaxID=373 RepID=UPI003D2E2E4B